jgi:outer membrane protein assembly factor BamB
VYVTSQDNSLYAIAMATRDERWGSEIGATLVGSPTVADGTVYVGIAGNALTALREV